MGTIEEYVRAPLSEEEIQSIDEWVYDVWRRCGGTVASCLPGPSTQPPPTPSVVYPSEAQVSAVLALLVEHQRMPREERCTEKFARLLVEAVLGAR